MTQNQTQASPPSSTAIVDHASLSPIFVVGIPRSGTTLLQTILSRNSQLYSLPETHYFESVLPAIQVKASEPLTEQRLATALEQLGVLMDLELSEKASEQLFEQARLGQLDGKRLFDWLLAFYKPDSSLPQTMRPIEKTPGHVQHLDEILKVYPAAKVVCILREPKNAISSVLLTPFVETGWLIWHCARWNATVRHVEQFRLEHPSVLLIVRYEDLVSESKVTLRKVCRFTGIEYEPTMLQDKGSGPKQKLRLEKETWKEGAGGSIIGNNPGAWRERISLEQGWYIDDRTKRAQEMLGYTSEVHISTRERIRAHFRNWTYLRRHTQDRGVSFWLMRKCRTLGQDGPARQLATGLLLGDMTSIMQHAVRSSLLGRKIMR